MRKGKKKTLDDRYNVQDGKKELSLKNDIAN